jgi:hypothetical protein
VAYSKPRPNAVMIWNGIETPIDVFAPIVDSKPTPINMNAQPAKFCRPYSVNGIKFKSITYPVFISAFLAYENTL